jgi:hypothetical protein
VLRGRHPIRVTVLEEIPCASFQGATPEELAERVRARIATQLEEKDEPPPVG